MAKNSIVSDKALVIGGSAGSLDVILKALPKLNIHLPIAVIIVLHRKNSFDSTLTDLFAARTKLPVHEIEEKQNILAGNIYIAPADYHLLFEKDKSFALDFSEKVNYSRPSIDVAFASASDVYKEHLACLLLSGANADGVEGLKTVKRNNGLIAVQSPDEAEVSFMPQQAIASLQVDYVLKNDELGAFINQTASLLSSR